MDDIEVWGTGLSWIDVLELSAYQAETYVLLFHPSWTNTMTNTPPYQQSEAVHELNIADCRMCLTLQLEPGGVVFVIAFEARFSGLEDLVDDFCARKWQGQRHVCIFSEHWGFVGCGEHEGCVKSIFRLVEFYVWKSFMCSAVKENLTANKEISDASWVLLAEMDGIKALKKEDIRSAPIRLARVHLSSQNIFHLFRSYRHHFSQCKRWHYISLICWFDACGIIFHKVDVKRLLGCACRVVESRWCHHLLSIPMQVLLWLLHLQYRTGKQMGRTIACSYIMIIQKLPLSMKNYIKGAMAVSISIYNRCAKFLRNMVNDGRAVDNSSWLVFTPFCEMATLLVQDNWLNTRRPLHLSPSRSVESKSFSCTTIYELLALISKKFELSLWWQKSKLL